MIQPLKFNTGVSFGANNTDVFKNFNNNPSVQTATSAVAQAPAQETAPQVAAPSGEQGGILYKAKMGILNFAKGINSAIHTGNGIIKGIVEGTVVAAGVAFIGKNIANSKAEGKNFASARGIFNSAKSVIEAPVKFYTSYLKGHKKLGVIATLLGAATFGLNYIHGRILTNRGNADLDHTFGEGHIGN